MTTNATPSSRFDGFAWLYIGTGVVVWIAPSLGVFGSLLRVIFALAGVAVAIVIYWRGQKVSRLRATEQAAFAMVLGGVLIAAVSPIGIQYSAARLINWIMFWPIALVFFQRPRYAAIAVALFGCTAIQAIAVSLQYQGALGGTWGGAIISGTEYNPFTSSWITRYTGLILDPNNLAVLMNLAAISAVTVFLLDRRWVIRTVCLIVLVVSAIVLVLTGSRGGLIAVPLGFAAFALIRGTKGLASLSAGAAAAIYAALVVRWDSLQNVLATATGVLDGQDASLTQRFAVWGSRQLDGFQLLVGKGFGGYDVDRLSGSGFDIAPDAARSVTIDNAWLKLLLEGGAVSVAFFLFLFATAFVAIWRARNRSYEDKTIAAAIGASLTVVLWRSFSVDALDINPYNFVLPVIVGASYAVGCASSVTSPSAVTQRRGDGSRHPIKASA